ncbi:uncharacterized protein LOC135805799 [Sycon ciliatum]|uniref:uncharacterized protein LOC135805799 n=2 Tax=Sycon ciliatum TaxID=27933 RepID=UPI0031F5FFF7
MYGLPKDHKATVPLRPVVSAVDSPVTNISIVLERILNQCLKYVPAHLKNTLEALEDIRQVYPDLQAPAGTIIVTMDVVALYPSIPIAEGVEAVARVLQQHIESVDTFGLSVEQIEELLTFVLRSNYFRFGEKVYHQREGIAMGNNLAPPFAIIFMHDLETSLLLNSPGAPVLYKRYIDDIIMLWTLGAALLRQLIAYFNTANASIKFTYQSSEETGSVDFMDTTIHVSSEGAISFELFRKACHSGLVSDFNSCVPQQQKLAIASSEFLRAARLSSDPAARQRSEQKVIDTLKFNNFPDKVIATAHERARRPAKQKKDYRSTLKLPFKTDAIHYRVHRLLNKYNLNVQIIYKNARLSNSVTKSSLTGPCCRKWVDPAAPRRRGRPKAACVACQSSEVECTRRNVVYRLTCKCSEKYVGETGRSVATRTKEHNDNSRNKTSGKALGEHYRLHHGGEVLPLGESAFTEVRVLATESDRARRRIREAIQIRDTSPSINNNAGWDLL